MDEYYIRSGLKKYTKDTWYDKDHLILYASMSLLEDFIEKECGGIDGYEQTIRDLLKEYVPIPQTNTMIEIAEIYRWWKYERPKVEETPFVYPALDADYTYQVDTKMLIRLMEVRKGLWT